MVGDVAIIGSAGVSGNDLPVTQTVTVAVGVLIVGGGQQVVANSRIKLSEEIRQDIHSIERLGRWLGQVQKGGESGEQIHLADDLVTNAPRGDD